VVRENPPHSFFYYIHPFASQQSKSIEHTHMYRIAFKNPVLSYLFVAFLGFIAGIITRLSDLFPSDTLWSFSSIASAFGFWILTTTLLIYFSRSNFNAAVNTFLYLSTMNFSFYFTKYLLGLFFPLFHELEGFSWGLLYQFDILALLCSAIGFVLYYWNKDNPVRDILYALPICGLGAETIGSVLFLCRTHTYLFQLILDSLALASLIMLFSRKVNHPLVFSAVILLGSISGAFLFYFPWV
jgi:hypothetical protein